MHCLKTREEESKVKRFSPKVLALVLVLAVTTFVALSYAANPDNVGQGPLKKIMEMLGMIEAKLDKGVNPGIQRLEAKLDKNVEILMTLEAKLDRLEAKIDEISPGPGTEKIEAKLDESVIPGIKQLEAKRDKDIATLFEMLAHVEAKLDRIVPQ
jgi:hypothetical protein